MKPSPMDVGTSMWMHLEPLFRDVVTLNKMDIKEAALLWTGFMAAAGASMAQDLGGEGTHAVLATVADQVRDLTRNPPRPRLEIVKP